MRLGELLDRIAWAPAAGARPARGLTVFRREMIVEATLDDTFAFFADASNLERLTPPWLQFRMRTALPVVMRAGAEIEYRIVLHGLPIPWLTRIDVWEPKARFVDRQLRGPYRWWRHEHRFDPVDGGTRVADTVEYAPRAAWLTAALVRRDLERIFAFRQAALPRLLAGAR